jgi:hypothetical protein
MPASPGSRIPLDLEFPAGETSILASRIIKLTATANKYKYRLSIFACSIFVIAQKHCAPTNIPSNKIAM